MSDPNDLAIQLAVLKAVGDHVKRLTAERKAELADAIKRGTVYARLGDEDLATVVLVPDRADWDVVDRPAFIRWCKANRPSAIIEAVRSSDEKAILDSIKDEVPDGVSPTPVSGYVQVKQTAAQVEALFLASTEGRLGPGVSQILELEG